MKLSDFDYDLPKELIAQEPAKTRSESKLMVCGEKIEHRHFTDILEYLKPYDVLVVNESKVLHAQIGAKKETGGKISVLVAEKKGPVYRCKIKGRRVSPGDTIIFDGGNSALVESQDITDYMLKIDGDVDEMLMSHGRVPLPPYIKHTPPDLSRYQTVYSDTPGSLAAPTAGLHFTEELLDKIRKKGVQIAKVTLHVSFGTFDRVHDPDTHKMEPEYYTVTDETARTINERIGRLVVVGTTSLKTLESAANPDGTIRAESRWSDLFIVPGHKFLCGADVLITNFHLPKSTLMMLVSAFFGRERMLELYRIAVNEKYRFFSFGDAMLLNRHTRSNAGGKDPSH